MDLRGSFCGVVEDNKDPQKLGRLKVRVPHIYGAVGGIFGAVTTNDLPWALPSGLPNGLTQRSGGADWLPDVGDQVIVNFLDNEPEKPVWQWFMQTQQAVLDFPLHAYDAGQAGSVGSPKRGAWVRYGHTVEWNKDGLILTTSKGYRLLLTDASSQGNDGDITLATQAGQSFEMDDSTGDTTLNVNHDWNINASNQILALADSFSLTTLTNEIEMISGSDLTIETNDDFKATVNGQWNMDVVGTSVFNLSGDWSAVGVKNVSLSAGIDMTIKAASNMALQATNQMDLSSTGVMTISTPVSMTLKFLRLSLGNGAASPFVLGDQLFAYLEALFQALVTHTHSGVLPGPSSTSTMIPPPPVPTSSMLSQVIRGL